MRVSEQEELCVPVYHLCFLILTCHARVLLCTKMLIISIMPHNDAILMIFISPLNSGVLFAYLTSAEKSVIKTRRVKKRVMNMLQKHFSKNQHYNSGDCINKNKGGHCGLHTSFQIICNVCFVNNLNHPLYSMTSSVITRHSYMFLCAKQPCQQFMSTVSRHVRTQISPE